ncbi:MAG: hypothetical protein JNK67_00365 [Alphaproteobacteria bacterium]|nr:hypothetical protein [Alphaproteobacteria bacterium]
MIRNSGIAALIGLALAPLVATAQQQNWKPVTVEEMKREIVGRTMAATFANRSEATFLLGTDGKVAVRGSATLDGTWRASDKGYCTTYPNRGEACFEIIRLADGTMEVYTDKGQFQAKMRPQ